MIPYFIALCFLIKLSTCREICFHEQDLGCFTGSKPFGATFQRPISFLPQEPIDIGTRFTLYNRDSRFGRVIDSNDIDFSYNAELKTKIIVHGFIHTDSMEWVQNMKTKIIEAEDVNVVTVDWSKGNGFPYTQATANSQVVGRQIAKLIDSICSETNANAGNFHIIGHSLGAHIAGYAGERLRLHYEKNLGRITGLDPAGPYFENTDPIVRLDPTDAIFVDAIHTDGSSTLNLGMGIYQAVGHVDFYPNGGVDQPDCPKTSEKFVNSILANFDLVALEKGVACSHNSAHEIFTDSIAKQCKYTSYPCTSGKDFDKGLCLKCGSKGCNSLGYWASPDRDTDKLYLNTQSVLEKPFCLENYKFALVSAEKILQTKGKFEGYFMTKSNRRSDTFVLDDNERTFLQNTKVETLISLKNYVPGEITTLHVSFKKNNDFLTQWLYKDTWRFTFIEVYSGENQSLIKFCPEKAIISSGSTVKFNIC